MIEVRFKALPKQKDFITATEREVLYSGAWGSGKSLALCLKLVVRATNPKAREGLFRLTLKQLKKTTLVTLLEGDGDTPAVLPHGTYEHHKADQVISLHGGGRILYGDLEDADKIGSMNLTGAAVEEAAELTRTRYTALRGRIRVKAEGLTNQLYGACNPGPPSHHLAERFGLALDFRCQEGCRAIRTRSSDNTHLPAAYLADLDRMTGVARKRYVEGLWVGSEGVVYDNWDRERHVRTVAPAASRVILGCDDGFTNPFVCLRATVDGDGRLHIERETYERGLLPAQKIAAVKRMGGEGAEAVLVDPSAAVLIADLRAGGMPAMEANNEVVPGIHRVQQRLGPAGDGEPRLTVDPECRNTMVEFESYEWKPMVGGSGLMKDQPKKENDHAMDVVRYMAAYLDSTPAFTVSQVIPHRERAEDRGPAELAAAHRAAADDRLRRFQTGADLGRRRR